MTLDISKQIKKIFTKVESSGHYRGFQFFDENDNEIAKVESAKYGVWKKQAMELPDGFSILGVYGNTNTDYNDPKFGFLIWNKRQT